MSDISTETEGITTHVAFTRFDSLINVSIVFRRLSLEQYINFPWMNITYIWPFKLSYKNMFRNIFNQNKTFLCLMFFRRSTLNLYYLFYFPLIRYNVYTLYFPEEYIRNNFHQFSQTLIKEVWRILFYCIHFHTLKRTEQSNVTCHFKLTAKLNYFINDVIKLSLNKNIS